MDHSTHDPWSIHESICPFTHSKTHNSIDPFIHPPTQPSILHSIIHHLILHQLFTHPPIYPFTTYSPINQSFYPSFHTNTQYPSIYPIIHLFIHHQSIILIHLHIYLSIHLSINSSIHPLIHHLSIIHHLFTNPSIHPPIIYHLSIIHPTVTHPSIHPSTHPSSYPSSINHLPIHPPFHLCICPSIHDPSIHLHMIKCPASEGQSAGKCPQIPGTGFLSKKPQQGHKPRVKIPSGKDVGKEMPVGALAQPGVGAVGAQGHLAPLFLHFSCISTSSAPFLGHIVLLPALVSVLALCFCSSLW